MQLFWGIDSTLFELLHSWYGASQFGDTIIYFFAEHAQYVIGAYFFYSLIMYARDRSEQLLTFASTLTSLILARLVVVEAIRTLWNRPRPFVQYAFTPPFPELSASFPSGHATFFFALAMMVTLHRRRHAWVYWGGSVGISLARVMAGVHYPADIIPGALIGCVVAYGVWKWIEPIMRTRIADGGRPADIL